MLVFNTSGNIASHRQTAEHSLGVECPDWSAIRRQRATWLLQDGMRTRPKMTIGL